MKNASTSVIDQPAGASARGLVILALSALPITGQAQSALEEVIVTASKRTQKLIDVPFAVSAITSEDIEKTGASNFKDLVLSVPGISMIEAGTGRNRVQIRGIANRIGQPTVGYYIDEIPVSTEVDGQLLDVRTLDLERVEVLRGPQGTLYGQGAMGGTVRFITAAPRLDAFSGKVELEGSQVADGGSGYRAGVVLNAPLAKEHFGVRLVAQHQQLPGWVDNTLTGREDINEGQIDTFRLKARWAATERVSLTATAMRQESEYDAEPQSNASGRIAQGLDSSGTDESTLANLQLDWSLGAFDLMASTSYIDRTQVVNQSIQSLAGQMTQILGRPFTGFVLPSVWDVDIKVQELRVSSKEGSAFTWTVGAFHRDSEELIGGTAFSTPAAPAGFVEAFGLVQNGGFFSKSIAVFGEGNYEFANGFGITLGARYFEDERSFFQQLATRETGKDTFDDVSPRLIFSYRLSDATRFYASASKGFRSGGFNNNVSLFPTIIPPSYDVEDLWTYELGMKASFADGRVAVEAAVFQSDYSNIVDLRAFTVANRTRVFRANAGDASGTGVELFTTIAPNERFSFGAQLSWNDLQYDTTTPAHNRGDSVDSVPELTASANAEFNVPVTAGGAEELSFRLSYQYRDEVGWRRRDINDVNVSDAFRSLDARIAMRWPRFEIALAGANLTDDYGVLFADQGNFNEPLRPQPRTISLSLRAEF